MYNPNSIIFEYENVLLFGIFAGLLASILFGISYLISTGKGDPVKLSPYECGFDPFEDARNKFDIRFYLVAILFILFDLEAAFLFPWASIVGELGDYGVWLMTDFLVELIFGFIYAWKLGALDWE